MPLYSDLPTANSGRTVDAASVSPSAVSTTRTEPPCGTPRADPLRTSRSSRAGDRPRVLAPVLLAVAALAGFALLMSIVTAPRAPAAAHQHAGHAGPVAADYVTIEAAPAAPPTPRPGPAASGGAFTSRCGRNTDGHRNSDNFITAPGRSNGAHHVHDYVGNTATDGTSTDQSLAAASTTCERGDKSVYFWPVLRDIRHAGADADRPGGGKDGNLGHILVPARVVLDFMGNPYAKVRPMPRFLRVVTGDAKAVTNGSAAHARAVWTCSGTQGRASFTHYPLCPAGQLVQRVGEFPSCWNGADTDSEDHRSHVTFPDQATGACPSGTAPIPRLRITLSYEVPPGRAFAIDSFPDQQRKAVTDHFDFENLMPESLMNRVVDCINSGRAC
jgi:Domain of unknown function (DUF1996)